MTVVEKKVVRGVEEFKMEVKIISKTDEKVALEFSETNVAEVNTIRRMIVSEVPTMAIEEVEFIKNDSALFDEFLANRLGLIPLVTDLNTYNEMDSCKCDGKGCPLCRVEFTLKAKGPGMVYASQLESNDETVRPVFGDMPIVKLVEGQELVFNAIAIMGRGRTHMKFAPGIAYYTSKPIFKINNDVKKIEQFRDQYPEQVFKDGKFDEEALLKDGLYDACEGVNDELLKIDYEEDKFLFFVESFGQLNAMDIIIAALEKFNHKIVEFEKAMKGDNISEKVIKDAVNAAKKVATLNK